MSWLTAHLPDPQQTATDLRAAAELLETTGWTQGDYTDGRGCHCAVGAIVAVLGGETGPSSIPDEPGDAYARFWPALSVLADGVPGARVGSEGRVTSWNDAPGRTAAQVTAALRAAAGRAEAQS